MPRSVIYQPPQQSFAPPSGGQPPHFHHGHQHHAHQHAPQAPQAPQPPQGMGYPGAGPNQMLMQVIQTPGGGWGLAPYTPPAPQGMGQAQPTPPSAPPTPNWGGLVLVLGGLGVAGWWAYKKWFKGEPDGSRHRERSEPERVNERTRSSSSGYYTSSRRRSSYGREDSGSAREERPDERRSRRSRTRMIAEYKRYLDTQGITE